nr:amino acid permease [Bacteroidales bacterium]
MPKAKKFGAFAGVFTPSILTILGVIMYMRLGWVVGEAGLIGALSIIVIAHVISISTGLSISSIATDKKIKTGGLYYMLSRSLGLPMGGAIGLSLVVGTALSISLYIVGFSESFIGVDAIRNFLGLGITINDFRILGSVVLVVLVIIAFISTSLAIKTQFIVLAAIVLSLISVIVGFFVNPGFAPEHVSLIPVRDGFPLEYVFAIYFPAVTGFTAGVAMSGDLKDPKKDIPKGTLFAVITGFVVYVLLAFSFAFFVNRDLLINDNNFLIQIAWFPPLVIAGIWGATLSSALGGILGAPRILQALSKDKIVPNILSKGYGENNEPRNALILIFLIAESGILIGNLNVIASLVSMFFLASYGFINISFSLESWASTDFMPSFRIPRFIGIIGFVASFIVMFKIDMLSMIFALILISVIYFFLRRRHYKNDFGDVWQSVWTSIIRKALKKLEVGEIEKRNWRPNIILFSGGTNARPHLIQLGKALLGKHGILSNFDLTEKKSAETLFPKSKQRITKHDYAEDGMFERKYDCRDIYEGIETISSTYGFAGVEPNTVLMGWGRQSKDPKRFAQMIETLNHLDHSILMVDYDEKVGFGDKKLIDIWWRGAGNNGNLALALVRFLIMSDDWANAKVRLLVVNPENDDRDLLFERTTKVLNDFRIDAEIVIINNKIEKKSFYEIIRRESINSDLIFLGLPNIEKGNAIDLVRKTNELTKNIGTVILVKASSYFSDLYIVDKNKYISSKTSHKELDEDISIKN